MNRRAPERARRLVRGPRAVGLAMLLLGLALAGCSGGGGPGDRGAEPKAAPAAEESAAEGGAPDAIAGSFVGEVAGSKAFVAIVAEPAAGPEEVGAVEVFVSDGKRLGERYSGSVAEASFVAKSEDGRREARGTLKDGSLRGTVELRGGKRVRFEAGPPSGAAGLYDLTVSAGGDLSGASAAGLGITGEIALEEQGSGMLKLVDGKRVGLTVTRNAAGPLRAAEARVIVLPSGQLRGAGEGRPTAGDGDPSFFIRSA